MDCAICYDAITAATGKVELSCSHPFHFSCLTSWFNAQSAKSLEQSCPCCRHESNEHEKMPFSSAIHETDDTDDDSYESDDESASQDLTEQEEINLAAAQERALFRFAKLKRELSKEDFEAYAASRISALFRGRCVRYKMNDIKNIKKEITERVCKLAITKMHLRYDKKALAFNMKGLTMPHTVWRNQVATIIQKAWRSNVQKIKARPPRAVEAAAPTRRLLNWAQQNPIEEMSLYRNIRRYELNIIDLEHSDDEANAEAAEAAA
jgi:hypothetical protein